jgi:hypothetical protein
MNYERRSASDGFWQPSSLALQACEKQSLDDYF